MPLVPRVILNVAVRCGEAAGVMMLVTVWANHRIHQPIISNKLSIHGPIIIHMYNRPRRNQWAKPWVSSQIMREIVIDRVILSG